MLQTRNSIWTLGLAMVSLSAAVPAMASVTLPPDDAKVTSLECESADLAEAVAKARTLVMSPSERTLVLASAATATPKRKSVEKNTRPSPKSETQAN